MSPAKLDIEIFQGSVFSLVLTWRNSAGALVDLTNYSASLEAKINKDDSTKVLDIDSTSEITLGGVDGTITIDLTATETAALDFSNAYYELLMTPGAGAASAIRLLEGNLTLSKQVH